jgi:hypothetical protein
MQFLMVSRWSGWKLWKILNSYLGSGVRIVWKLHRVFFMSDCGIREIFL